jgi:hypothetical protein
MAQGTGAGIFFGLVIVACVITAGWVSRGWSVVKALPPGPKAFVWTVAVPGLVSGICFLWLMIIHSWGARRNRS